VEELMAKELMPLPMIRMSSGKREVAALVLVLVLPHLDLELELELEFPHPVAEVRRKGKLSSNKREDQQPVFQLVVAEVRRLVAELVLLLVLPHRLVELEFPPQV
jgi:hypothetical protein